MKKMHIFSMKERLAALGSIGLVSILAAVLIFVSFPAKVSITGKGVLSFSSSYAIAASVPAESNPAYQVCIPNGEGSEIGLQVFPPKLQIDGKDNWLAVQSPQGLDVSVGTYTYDAEQDPISVDKYSGAIKIDSISNNLIITAGALSDKCKYDIEVANYTLYGGEIVKLEREGKETKDVVTELRAVFRSYTYGSGSDLYQLENTPQRQEELATGISRTIEAVRIYAYVIAQTGVSKATASTKVLINGKKYNGDTVALSSTEQRIETTYTTNPQTGLPFIWQDIDDLQAGVTLKDGECSYVYAEVELVVHSQTFYPITPVEVTPGTANDWIDVNGADFGVPEGATGVILHLATGIANVYIGLRKNGSTDSRTLRMYGHSWAAIGIDAAQIFEAYIESTTYNHIWLVGYTMSGVTFFTNAYDKSLATTGAWTDIDCHTEAPNAIGLVFEVLETSNSFHAVGLRKNGSSDNHIASITLHAAFGAIVGCDAGQICEGYIDNIVADFYLVGYITDGCTFNTNATDVSLGTTNEWLDLAALPANSVMGFIEVNTTVASRNYGLRKNGSSENIYQPGRHPWAFVECDASGIIEGEIIKTDAYFFVVGYATAEVPPEPEITNTPTSYDFGIVSESSTLSTGLTYFTCNSTSSGAVNITVSSENFTGGNGWIISDTANPGSDIAGLKAGLSGQSYNVTVRNSPTYSILIYGMAPQTNQQWGLQILAPTSFSDGVVKSGNVTLTATLS